MFNIIALWIHVARRVPRFLSPRERARSWQNLGIPLTVMPDEHRAGEEILASKFGSMDQFGWFMDYDILCMLACLVSSVTVLD